MGQQTEGRHKTFTSGEALLINRLVKQNAAGAVVYCDANHEAIGVTQDGVANAEYVTIALLNSGGTFKMTAVAAIAAGEQVYSAADGKIDDTPGAFVGTAQEAASGDGSVIEVLPNSAASDVTYAAVAASSEVENTTTETAFDTGTVTIEDLHEGDIIRVLLQGYVVDNNSTDTLTVKLYAGTEEIVTTGAVDAADADIFLISCDIVIRTVGASGTLVAAGLVGLGVPGTVTAKPFLKASATEDMTSGLAITAKATWSVAHADNEVRMDIMNVTRVR